MSIIAKLSFKDQAFRLRESAILDATTSVLASKGFDLMTMDDIALEVGISKPVLYKHFKSKEDLVGEAMIRLLAGATEFIEALPDSDSPVSKLKALLEWALRIRLGGGLPFLPATSPQVREMLTRNLRYVTRVVALNKKLTKIVQEAKKKNELRSDLPDDVILFSYYARTCDPTTEYLRLYASMDTDSIIRYMQAVCFEGISV